MTRNEIGNANKALGRENTEYSTFSHTRWAWNRKDYTEAQKAEMRTVQSLFADHIGDKIGFSMEDSYLGMNEKFTRPRIDPENIDLNIPASISPELSADARAAVSTVGSFMARRLEGAAIGKHQNDPVNMFCCFLIKSVWSVAQERCNTLEGADNVLKKTEALINMLSTTSIGNIFHLDQSIYTALHYVSHHLEKMSEIAKVEKKSLSSREHFRSIYTGGNIAWNHIIEYLCHSTHSNPSGERMNIALFSSQPQKKAEHIDKPLLLIMDRLLPLQSELATSSALTTTSIKANEAFSSELVSKEFKTKSPSNIQKMILSNPSFIADISKLLQYSYEYHNLLKQHKEAEQLAGNVGNVGMYACLREETQSLMFDSLELQKVITSTCQRINKLLSDEYSKFISSNNSTPDWRRNMDISRNLFAEIKKDFSVTSTAIHAVLNHMNEIPPEVEMAEARRNMDHFIKSRLESSARLTSVIDGYMPIKTSSALAIEDRSNTVNPNTVPQITGISETTITEELVPLSNITKKLYTGLIEGNITKEELKQLVRDGARTDGLCTELGKPFDGYKALHLAVLTYNKAAIEGLLELGVNINEKDGHDKTPLDIICSRRKFTNHVAESDEILKLLRNNEAKSKYADENTAKLHNAVRESLRSKIPNQEIIKTVEPFIHGGAEIDDIGSDGNTVLHIAALNNNKELVDGLSGLEYSVSTKTSLHVKNKDGKLPYDLMISYILSEKTNDDKFPMLLSYITNNQITEINLSEIKGIGPSDIETLSAILTNNTSLTKIDFGGIKVGDNEKNALRDAIMRNNSLEEVTGIDFSRSNKEMLQKKGVIKKSDIEDHLRENKLRNQLDNPSGIVASPSGSGLGSSGSRLR